MGRLIGLELCNFKSYKDKATIGFGSSFFTSIIGPNGCGKSNMMDAISFVLGINSTQLRSQNLKDLIYRGRVNPDYNLDSAEQDPTSAYVMATYEKDDGELIKLKRTLTANGNSEYQINDRSVTMLNYSKVLQSENILIKARNFLVFQGDVEQIASQAPKDLTRLIEHISGSNEYTKEFDKLKEESEKAHEESNMVFARKRNLNSESKQYKEQIAEQKKFENLIRKKTETIKKIQLYKLFHNEKKHHQLKDSISKKKTELKELKNTLSTRERILKSMQSDYSKAMLELKKLTHKYNESEQKIESTERELIPIDASKISLSYKITSQNKKVSDLENDLERQSIYIKSVEKQLRDAKKLYNQFQEKTFDTSIIISPDAQKEYEQLRSEYLSTNGSELEEQISLILNDKDSFKNSKANLEIQKANAEKRVIELELLSGDLNSKLSEASDEFKVIFDKKSEKTEAKNKLLKQKDEYNQKELSLNTQLRDVLLRLDELSSQQRESNKQKKLRENISTLKRLLPQGSIKGLAYELIQPSQQKYELALSTLLGRNFDAIIVESSQIAYQCIEILKERRAGIATFIPLDSIDSEPIDLNYLRSLSTPGLDILKYDKSLEPAINHLIGNTLVTETIDEARNLKFNKGFENKIVTIQGSVIHKSNLMTGGQQKSKINWDKQEWIKLNDVKEQISLEISKLQESKPKELDINLLTEEISNLDDKLPILRNQKSSLERTIKDRQVEIDFQKSLVQGFEENILKKVEEMKKIDEKVDSLTDELRKIKNEKFKIFCEKYSLDDIEHYENTHGNALRYKAKERNQYTKAIATLSNKLEFEEGRLKETQDRKSSIEHYITDLDDDLKKVLQEKSHLEEYLDKLESENVVVKDEIKSYETLLETKMKKSKTAEADVDESYNDIIQKNKEINQIDENLLNIDNERANILKYCKIQNIALPLLKGEIDNIPIVEDLEDSIKEIYKIEVDYDLDEKYKESFNIKLENELVVSLSNLTEELESLAPNSKASERFKNIENRIKSHDKEYTKARNKEKQIQKNFNAIKDLRFKKFMEAFSHISEKIDTIYKELTKSPASPLGGSAYLTLEDEELPYLSGIKYHTMPPMKRFRDMELLSGGEKTIAALALLFAIHSYQPAPFFVLDEIDAALDHANVIRVGNYIKKHAGPNFQFIVISLKNSLFEKSDSLIGIYREQRKNSSKTS
ncbi:unnamed protein product [Candida verbasci]|uniref:Structural maintenance of chromosomes protein n=1 Tax=Candida verbasci TaxID=1227364 RepID=A0A9W4TQ30_9ASCO|nr:unnamed protein product [Candida verbasci]